VLVDDRVPPTLVSVDVHLIPSVGSEPAHRHHDLMFGFVAAGRAADPASTALRAAWCPPHRLEEFVTDRPLQRAVARAVHPTTGRLRRVASSA
jgi:hypothetical protein